MMINLLGIIGVSMVFIGGGLFQAGYPASGLASSGLGTISLGLLFAAAESATRRTAALCEGFTSPAGLTVRQMMAYILDYNVDMDTTVYVGDQGINPASGVFPCLLDGRRAFVIERKDSE